MIATARRRGRDTTLRVITPNARTLSLTPRDFGAVPEIAAHVKLPVPFQPNSRAFLQSAAGALSKSIAKAERASTKPALSGDDRSMRRAGKGRKDSGRGGDSSGGALGHPVEQCPDFADHLKAANHADRLRAELSRIDATMAGREHSLTNQFDRLIGLLSALGYVDGWSLTPAGELLGGLYHEADLLIAESLRAGLFDGLQPAAVAALASVFVYEARGPGAAARRGGREASGRRAEVNDRRNRDGDLPDEFPRQLSSRWWKLNDLADDLAHHELTSGVPLTRRIDPGFVHIAQRWAQGDDLEEVLADEEISGGDFVRTTKTLIDLLRQIGTVAPLEATAKAARSAADALTRGVILASSLPTRSVAPSAVGGS